MSRSIGNSSEDSLCKFIVVLVTGLACYLIFKTDLIFYYIHYLLYIIMNAVNIRKGNFV